MYTIRHDYIDENEILVSSSYDDPIALVDAELHENPSLIDLDGRDEYDLYRELGFTQQEYEDLKLWKKSLVASNFSLTAAFDHFVDQVIRELQHAQ